MATIKPTKRALLIGINYFGTDAELSGCLNDILDVKLYLESCGFTEFIVLTDTPSDPNHLLADSPTRDNILAAMKKLVGLTAGGDTLYIHYSGHGSQLADQRTRSEGKDEVDGQDECICPVDFDWNKPDSGFIRDDTLCAVLVKNLAAGSKLRVVFDSCHSGSALDLPFRWVSGSTFADENTNVLNKDIVFLSGCKDSQTSADSAFSGRANGALTWAYLKSLADIRKSGSMTSTYRWKDLGEMIRLRLKRGGYDQIPQICVESRSQMQKTVDLI